MSKTNRPYRPYVRPRRAGSKGAGPAGGAAGLASRAGQGGGGFGQQRSSIDVLDPRKLLFSLTVTANDVNPATGLGTVTAQFGYVAPFLFRPLPLPNASPDEVVTEDFDDEMGPMAPWTMNLPPTPPSGTFFLQSDIRIRYSTISATPVILTPDPGSGMMDQDLAVTLSTNDNVSFEFWQGATTMTPRMRIARSATTTIVGLNVDPTMGSRIELLRDGAVVRTILGAQLNGIRQAVQGEPDMFRYTLTANGGFDSFRVSSAALPPDNSTYFDNFTIEEITETLPGGRFTDFTGTRIFGAQAVLTGPVGASARFLDLYGREILETIFLDAPEGVSVPDVDRNDDGVPDFNDGLGSVVLTGVNQQSVLSMWGGTIMSTAMPPFVLAGVTGLFDNFEQAGFGYGVARMPPDMPPVLGLPPGPGSIILGSPIVRDNSSPAAYLSERVADLFPGVGGGVVGAGFSIPDGDWFVRPDQGIFVPNNETMGSVLVHGILHGSSQFSGALGRFNVGLMPGSLSVNGDLGQLAVGSDAGMWVRDDLMTPVNLPTPVNETHGEIHVGRTVGQLAIAGRSAINVSVAGDINNTARQALNFLDYSEQEVVYGINPALMELAAVNATLFATAPGQQAVVFGNRLMRNDSITSAEYIGYNAAAVRISGQLGLQDPVNTNEDAADVYAFAADGSTDVVIEGSFGAFLPTFGGFLGFRGLGLYARIVDRDGRVVAASSAPDISGRNAGVGTIRFRPDHPDVYYVVVGDLPDGNFASGSAYQLTLSGMAPTTFGSYRSGAATGNGGGGLQPNVISLGSGSMGSLRVGTGYFSSTGGENDTTEVLNNNLNADDLLQFNQCSISIPGNLYNITAGSDVNGAQIFIGGDLGGFVTGLAPAAGVGVTEGDFTSLDMTVGGRIGLLDVKGGIGIDQDADPDARGGIVTIRTGSAGGSGSIGVISVGAYISAAAFTLNTQPGSTIDAFLVGTNNGGAGTDFPSEIRDGQPFIHMGPGSDLRFADFALIQRAGDPDARTPLAFGQTLQLTDDAGATVRLRIVGGTTAANVTSSALIRVLPIDGSQGVAIARIDVTLNGGASLQIDGLTPGVASIGRINVTTDGTGGSTIIIGGSLTEIDVWRIDQVAGAALAQVSNLTPHGDIVAMDLQALNTLRIGTGDLGRTQTHGIGPTLLGPFLGLQRGLNQTLRGPLGISGAAIDPPGAPPDWDGSIFTPVAVTDYTAPSPLEDLGSPLDPYLNGLVVRTGDVTLVSVGGAIGDVILQQGHLITLTANADNISALGDFDGIIGNIYAPVIGTVDVGDGLLGEGPGPFATAGIFAEDDIVRVVGSRRPGLEINGLIMAANIVAAPRVTIGTTVVFPTPLAVTGIGQVDVRNGRYNNALIYAGPLDDFWQSLRVTDMNYARGDVSVVNGVLTDMFRTAVQARNIGAITLQAGAFDASFVDATGNIGNVFAAEFRNTTRDGEPVEFRENTIRATGNLASVVAYNLAGDMADLVIDIGGSITGGVSARNLVRVDLQVDNTVQEVFAANDVRAVNVNAGRLIRIFATSDIRSTSVNVAGPIIQVLAGQNITSSHFASTGPDGQINLIQSQFFLTGEISSSGPIGTITSVRGDVIGSIVTTDGDGSIQLLNAGHDLLVSTDIAGDVVQISAGRNIGQQGEPRGSRVINVQQNLTNILTPNGQIYTDVRVGESITGVIRNGRVAALPGNDQVSSATFVAYGRINAFQLNGDFNGSIISESGGIGSVQITSGSFRPGNRIEAHDGSIDSVVIIGGHLMGDIIAEETIGSIQVLAGADGFWGDIGINPFLSQFNPFDSLRNQLPSGVAADNTYQGPAIRAGTNIGLIQVERGSMWETSIIAGHSVGQVRVAGVIMDNNPGGPGLGGFIVGGDSVGIVDAGALTRNVIILAGVTDLGADGTPGGVGANADTVQFGRIGDLTFHADTNVVIIASGINAGPDGLYDNADDAVANGISSVNSVTVTGVATNSFVFADNGIGPTSAGIVRGGPGLHQAEPNKVIEFVPPASEQVPALGLAFTTAAGETGTITLTGPGQAYWNATLGRLALINTTLVSTLVVSTNQNQLTNFTVISNDGSSIGLASIRANLVGNSNFYFDGYVGFVEFGGLNMTGSIGAGNDIGALVVGPITRGTIDANHIQSIVVGGDFGTRSQTGEANIRLLSGGSIVIGGNDSGLISVKRDLGSVNVAGAIDRGAIRSGRSIGLLLGASMSESRVSARNDVSVVRINGDVFDSFIYAGADLGSDGAFGGTGTAADVVTNGNISSVFVGGNFLESDIAAGVLRGPDGFLGTADDEIDEGHSNIGPVTIAGSLVGSTFDSESYRVVSNGTVGTVRVAGQPFSGQGNFRVNRIDARPNALRVMDLSVTEDSRVYTARITFNQPVDQSTISAALNVFEVRNSGAVTIRLSEDVDYSVTYDASTNSALVTFSRTVTERSLPQTNGLPGPGVYRFNLDASILRGQTQNALLDGNGDGVPVPGDNFSGDAIVGDAGDKLVNNTVVTGGHTIDFYAATDLNLVMDNNFTPDGQPDVNSTVIIRGTIGDHQDQDINLFRAAGDVDLYRITLRAGQILRMGAMQGVAQLADRELLDLNGQPLTGTNAMAQQLPGEPGDVSDLTFEQQFLIKQTGTYFIGVASNFALVNVADPSNVANISTLPGATGGYSFTVRVFDDGDTGFAGDTDSGNGVGVMNAPAPSAFAGSDGLLNTADDRASLTTGLYTFTLSAGADGVRGTADDLVSGTNGSGITSQRTSGPDGLFGTADDRIISFVGASIGEGGFAGVPTDVIPDVDVFHLNNGDPILPGTHIRATLQLTELGSNIGLSPNPTVLDLRGDVQFALFETSTSVGVDDALLVASPTDVLPVGGTPNTVTTDGITSYGYDASGDFFIDFIVPGRQGIPGATPAKYALYIQGAIRSDYSLEIITQGVTIPTRSTQNILLETHGGTIDWLEAGRGVTTDLGAFRTSVVGFSGLIGAQTVDNYVLTSLLSSLDDIFTAANIDIRLSTNPAAFEGQDFSTVFLTGNNEPTAFFNNGTFGASQHSDPFNADRNDEAVVFMPQLSVLGNPPTRAGVDSFVQSLTAAVARRVGELVGLRTLDDASAPATEPMGATSVENVPGSPYRFSNATVNLSANFDALADTNFFLGQQSSGDLLDRILAARF